MLIKVESQKSKVKSLGRKMFFILPFAFCLLPYISNAQCAMCRASLESSGNVSQAEAVNDGIIYLMIIPYVLVVLIAFAVYRMYKKKK